MYISGLPFLTVTITHLFVTHDIAVLFNMRASTVSAILGLAAGFASAAPVQPKEVQNREAEAQWYDITYVDKVKREEAEKKREAEAQWYG
jgi:hypothetical protein